MTLDDFDEFCKVVVGFAELKGKQLSTPALKLYFRALQHWDLADFQQAAEHLLRTCEFMPVPKDFEDLRKAGEPTPAEAWSTALAACVDWRNPELLPDGRIGRAARAIGGFRAIAMADEERDLPHVQRRFLDAYEQLSDVEATREALPQIATTPEPRRLRGPVSIANALPRALARGGEPKETEGATGRIEPLQLPTQVQAKRVATIDARDKVRKLLALEMADADIAKVSGQPVEFVRELRASSATEAA